MASGKFSHLALTVSDLERSTRFYDEVLGFLGYRRDPVPRATQEAMGTTLIAWGSPDGAVTIRPEKAASAGHRHDRYAVGLNHFAFGAGSRAEVDGLYAVLKKVGAAILDPPTDYPYFPEYYAVYFADPDGIKFEYAFARMG